MRTSATCLLVGRSSAGFTLIEILVVLAIAGLLTSIVLPQLQNLAKSIEIASQRKDLKIALEGLGYYAHSSSRPLSLEGSYPRKLAAGLALPFSVPQGWRIEAGAPIRYAINGACTGGRVALIAPDQSRETFQLSAPKCQLDAVAGSP